MASAIDDTSLDPSPESPSSTDDEGTATGLQGLSSPRTQTPSVELDLRDFPPVELDLRDLLRQRWVFPRVQVDIPSDLLSKRIPVYFRGPITQITPIRILVSKGRIPSESFYERLVGLYQAFLRSRQTSSGPCDTLTPPGALATAAAAPVPSLPPFREGTAETVERDLTLSPRSDLSVVAREVVTKAIDDAVETVERENTVVALEVVTKAIDDAAETVARENTGYWVNLGVATLLTISSIVLFLYLTPYHFFPDYTSYLYDYTHWTTDR